MSKYNVGLELEHENSLSLIIKEIKPNSTILEFGPSHGRLTQYLTKKLNCIVDIVELDEEAGRDVTQYARQALIGAELGNIENYNWMTVLKDNKYDYIIFADVLEHLYNPRKALSAVKEFLSEKGQVIISIPNVGHDGILLELLNEQFNYRPTGLLDDTHIRFFTYTTLLKLIDDAGFIAIKENAHYAEVAQTEFVEYVQSTESITLENLEQRVFGNVYQFIFTLSPKERNLTKEIQKINNCRPSKYFSKLYIKEKEDSVFSEEKAILAQLTAEGVYFNLEQFNAIEELRLDPCEQSIVVHLQDYSKNISLCDSNALIRIEDKLIFNTNDPQIIFKVSGDVKSLYFKIELMPISMRSIHIFVLPIVELINIQAKEFSLFLNQKDACVLEQEEIIAKKEVCILEQEEIIAKKNSCLSAQHEQFIILNEEIEAQHQELHKLCNQIALQSEELQMVYKSKSWRITNPLRLVMSSVRKAKQFILSSKHSIRVKLFNWSNFKLNQNEVNSSSNNILALQQLSSQRVEFVNSYVKKNSLENNSIAIDLSIVTYNSEKWIDSFFSSLLQTNYRHNTINVICVDNGSTDNTLNLLKSTKMNFESRFASFKIIESSNKGFGHGHDLAIKEGNSDYILVANVDLEFQPDSIAHIVTRALNDIKEKIASWEFRQIPYEHPKYYDPVTQCANWSSHACILLSRAAYLEVGGYEPRIFMYAEDVELSYRFRSFGYGLRYCPEAVVTHYTYEDIHKIKPMQFKGSTLGNAYLRLRYGTHQDRKEILPLYLMLFSSPKVYPNSRKDVIKNIFSILFNYRYFKDSNFINKTFVAPFRGFDYELIRTGAIYPIHIDSNIHRLVSVIIRTYMGRERFLKEALISAENQTYKNIEIIVVEDGGSFMQSTVQALANEFNKTVRYYACDKIGRSGVGNVGLKNSKGDYCIFLDDDDLFFADHIETLIQPLEKDDHISASYSTAFVVPTDITLDKKNYQERAYNLAQRHDWEFNFDDLLIDNYFPIQTVLFRRSLFEERGGFNESLDYLEDWNLWIRYAYNNQFKYIRKTTSLYRVPADNNIIQNRNSEFDKAYEIAKAHALAQFSRIDIEISRDYRS